MKCKERPILFSGPIVRAILAGRNTQTRLIVKPQPPSKDFFLSRSGQDCGFFANKPGDDWRMTGAVGIARGQMGEAWPTHHSWKCPYGKPGDRLWVMEKHAFIWADSGLLSNPRIDRRTYSGPIDSKHNGAACVYATDYAKLGWDDSWKPSILMPRWASRITLEITGVRVERLNEISEADAMAEGIESSSNGVYWKDYSSGIVNASMPEFSYMTLWESINGPGSWAANPWVWVVEFRRVDQ